MGWKGFLFGNLLGGAFGGALGAIVGAAAGHSIEESLKQGRRRRYSAMPPGGRESVFCAAAAAMLAKLAKADGRITADEIESVENAFRRLGLSPQARQSAVRAFRLAKDDSNTIYKYAGDFASAVRDPAARVLLYELLWDLACADGVVTRGEDRILRSIPAYLGIPPGWYGMFARERLSGNFSSSSGGSSGGGRDYGGASASGGEDPYEVLGVPRGATDAEVKSAYRALAMKWHPDALRSQGVPEHIVERAGGRMAKINAAWAAIRKERGL